MSHKTRPSHGVWMQCADYCICTPEFGWRDSRHGHVMPRAGAFKAIERPGVRSEIMNHRNPWVPRALSKTTRKLIHSITYPFFTHVVSLEAPSGQTRDSKSQTRSNPVGHAETRTFECLKIFVLIVHIAIGASLGAADILFRSHLDVNRPYTTGSSYLAYLDHLLSPCKYL